MTDKYKKIADTTRQLKTCKKKVSYSTPAHAETVGKKNNQLPYECPICANYHLTSRRFKPFNWLRMRKQ